MKFKIVLLLFSLTVTLSFLFGGCYLIHICDDDKSWLDFPLFIVTLFGTGIFGVLCWVIIESMSDSMDEEIIEELKKRANETSNHP